MASLRNYFLKSSQKVHYEVEATLEQRLQKDFRTGTIGLQRVKASHLALLCFECISMGMEIALDIEYVYVAIIDDLRAIVSIFLYSRLCPCIFTNIFGKEATDERKRAHREKQRKREMLFDISRGNLVVRWIDARLATEGWYFVVAVRSMCGPIHGVSLPLHKNIFLKNKIARRTSKQFCLLILIYHFFK